MKLNDFPIVTLELHKAAERLCSQFVINSNAVADELARHVDSSIKDLDVNAIFKEALTKVVQQAVQQSLEGYFYYGDGRKMIDAVVDAGMKKKMKR